MARTSPASLVLTMGLWAPSAWAEGEQTTPQVDAPSIERIERGAFFSLEAGPSYLVVPDVESDYGLGIGASLYFGFDVVDVFRLSIGSGAVAAGGSFTDDLTGVERPDDRLYLSPGIRAQLALFTTERQFLWVRAEGGAGFVNAGSGGNGKLGPSFGASLSYEYFSVLRHFSLGVQVGVSGFLEPELALAIQIHPTLRYTF